jgi:hypothetical protein
MIVRALFVAVGLLNLAPGIVALVPSRAYALYGITLGTPALAVTMRHRAALLACVGVFMLLAAGDARWRTPALTLAWASKVTFFVAYALEGCPSGPLRRVAAADGVAVVALLVLAWLLQSRS